MYYVLLSQGNVQQWIVSNKSKDEIARTVSNYNQLYPNSAVNLEYMTQNADELEGQAVVQEDIIGMMEQRIMAAEQVSNVPAPVGDMPPAAATSSAMAAGTPRPEPGGTTKETITGNKEKIIEAEYEPIEDEEKEIPEATPHEDLGDTTKDERRRRLEERYAEIGTPSERAARKTAEFIKSRGEALKKGSLGITSGTGMGMAAGSPGQPGVIQGRNYASPGQGGYQAKTPGNVQYFHQDPNQKGRGPGWYYHRGRGYYSKRERDNGGAPMQQAQPGAPVTGQATVGTTVQPPMGGLSIIGGGGSGFLHGGPSPTLSPQQGQPQAQQAPGPVFSGGGGQMGQGGPVMQITGGGGNKQMGGPKLQITGGGGGKQMGGPKLQITGGGGGGGLNAGGQGFSLSGGQGLAIGGGKKKKMGKGKGLRLKI